MEYANDREKGEFYRVPENIAAHIACLFVMRMGKVSLCVCLEAGRCHERRT